MSSRKSSMQAARTKRRVDRAWERLSSPNLLPDVEDQNKREGIFCHRNERIGSTLCVTTTTCISMSSPITVLSIYALEFSR